jgi:hypothetical protein
MYSPTGQSTIHHSADVTTRAYDCQACHYHQESIPYIGSTKCQVISSRVMLQALFVATRGNVTSGSTWKHREGWTTAATSSPSNDTNSWPDFCSWYGIAMTEMMLGMAMYALLTCPTMASRDWCRLNCLRWNCWNPLIYLGTAMQLWISQAWPLLSP